MEARDVQPVETKFTMFNKNISGWNQPFNQVLFLNYDTVNSVFVNLQPVPPAQVVGGNTYPTTLTISLNVGEENRSDFSIDFGGSATGKLHVIYTQYEGAQPNNNKY